MLALFKLLEIALPLGMQVFASFKRNSDGSMDVEYKLVQNNIKIDAALQQAADFFASHPDVVK